MNGTIDDIVSDHSPSTLELKDLGNGDFEVAWGGVSSLQLGVSLTVSYKHLLAHETLSVIS